VSGCGGGGGSSNGPTAEQIVGTYSLYDFEFLYDNGLALGPQNYWSCYGYLSVNPDGSYYAEWIFNNQPMQDWGSWMQQSSSAALLYSDYYDCTIYLPFRFQGGFLITVNDHQCGNDTRWTNVWARN